MLYLTRQDLENVTIDDSCEVRVNNNYYTTAVFLEALQVYLLQEEAAELKVSYGKLVDGSSVQIDHASFSDKQGDEDDIKMHYRYEKIDPLKVISNCCRKTWNTTIGCNFCFICGKKINEEDFK